MGKDELSGLGKWCKKKRRTSVCGFVLLISWGWQMSVNVKMGLWSGVAST